MEKQVQIEFNQYKRLIGFLEYFFPNRDFNNLVVDARTGEYLILLLALTMDTLIKGENLYKKRNFSREDKNSFFTMDTIELLKHISLYLGQFDTRIFNFTRPERHTFIFIIDNTIDYVKSIRAISNPASETAAFKNYSFWLENLFKMLNQKISGSIYPSKKLNIKNVFNTDDVANNELLYSNSYISFSISPFILNREEKNWFLSNVNKTHGYLEYTNLESGQQFIMENQQYDLKVFEFAVSNFDFATANVLKHKLNNQKSILLEIYPRIESALNYYNEHQFQESYTILKDLAFDSLDLPLVYLLQIKNLVNLNRTMDVKKLIQNFLMLYPYYAEGYEIMGDVYYKEEDLEVALNFYEKVLKLTQDKKVAEKMKKVREAVERNRQQLSKDKSEYFFDIMDSIIQADDKFLMREKEMRQMIEIMLSDTRRNLLLVGDSGVGKTSLIRLLGMKILNNEVPEVLKEKRLREINYVSLLTGSKYRGQFEEKVVKLLTDFKGQKAILVLEDVHMMIASGTPRATTVDFINILKSFLRDKSIQVIATTNYEEYKNNIEKDTVLMGFFQKVTVNEMSETDVRDILINHSERIFLKEKIVVSGNVIDQVIECAKRDIREKRCPDSAILILERALAKVRYRLSAENSRDYEIKASDISEVVSDMLNLPQSNMPLSLHDRLTHLKENLEKEIVGQDEAMSRIHACITTAKLNYDIKKGRPEGVFLFIGPTGVGKTETALAIARVLYGSENSLIRIDMSEYMEKYTYSRFVGAAPGYVGYMDTNQLTDKVRQNPFSIILLDEIEKADSQLMNIFLQVFDAGRLTDARGNVVDFSHTTIIMTSNIGTSLFSKTSPGYQSDLQSNEVSSAALFKALKKYFSPEFLNRVDEVLIFKQLKESDIAKIIELLLRSTRETLEKQNKELVIHEDVLNYIKREGYSKEYGARHLGRVIRRTILEKVAFLSLEKEWEEARRIIFTMDKNRGEVIGVIDEGVPVIIEEDFIEKLEVLQEK